MASPKFENLLNLALDATERELEKSEQLGVGYNPEEDVWELIVKYSGDIKRLEEEFPGIQVFELLNQFAIVIVPRSLIDVIAMADEVEYVEKPKRLYFAVAQGKQASCITPLQTARYNLSGEGVIVAILDSGIDYSHPDFRNEDGTTRILNLWDQTLDREFSEEEINQALAKDTEAERYALVPSRDTSGHGTHVNDWKHNIAIVKQILNYIGTKMLNDCPFKFWCVVRRVRWDNVIIFIFFLLDWNYRLYKK